MSKGLDEIAQDAIMLFKAGGVELDDKQKKLIQNTVNLSAKQGVNDHFNHEMKAIR